MDLKPGLVLYCLLYIVCYIHLANAKHLYNFLQCWTNVEANVVQMFCLLGKGELYMILLTDDDGSQYSHHMLSSD